MSALKRLVLCASLASAGCTNFDALVERACASGRCGGDIVSNDPPVLVADHLLLDFGQTTSDGQPKQRLTLTNVDGGTADSLTFNFMGPAATNFALSSNGCTSLTPGESCPVDVQYASTDTTLGVRNGDLLVGASQGTPLMVALRIEIVAALSAPPVVDFGDVAVGTSLTLPVPVTNNLPRIAAVAPTIPPPFYLAPNGNDCTTVGMHQTCNVNVLFDAGTPPSGDIERTMFLDLEQNRATVTLRGRAVATGQLTVEPKPLFASDAGAAVEKGTTKDIVFTVHNTGTQLIKAIEYDLAATPAWSVLDAGCASLEAGASCQGVLRFAPTALDFHPATLVVDAGVIGSDVTSGTGRGVGVAQLQVSVLNPDSGLSVTQSLDGGVCTGQCTYSAWTDPSGPTVVRLMTQEQLLYAAPRFNPHTPTCDRVRCDVPLDRDVVSTSVSQDPLAKAFVTAQPYSGAFSGGIAGADTVCQAEAGDAGIAGHFAALLWLSDGGAGLSRFDAGFWIWPTGGVAIEPDGGVLNPLFQVWSGSGYAGAYTCGNWTTTGTTGSFVYGAAQLSITTCNVALNVHLVCLETEGATPSLYDGAATIFATSTSGLAVNFESECGDAGALLGFGYARPYVTRAQPACRSFTTLPDGGAGGDAGFFGGLYRADGWRVLLSAEALENCNIAAPTPTLLAPIAWAIMDGGLHPADSRPVKTVGEGYSIAQLSGSTNCNSWTTAMSGPLHRNYGNATVTDTSWWAGGNYIDCGQPSYLYCVGHR